MRTALTAQVALATAAGGLAAGLLASWAAESTTDLRAGVVVRTVTVLALLAAVPYLLVRRHVLDDRRGPLLAAGVLGTVLGYAANPMAWDGRAFFTQLITPPGATTAALDLLGWVSVGALAVLAASRSAATHGEPVGYRTQDPGVPGRVGALPVGVGARPAGVSGRRRSGPRPRRARASRGRTT